MQPRLRSRQGDLLRRTRGEPAGDGQPPQRPAVPGAPRSRRSTSLDLRPGRFVVFMPTYRSAKGGRSHRRLEGQRARRRIRASPHCPIWSRQRRGAGLEVVVKPHPLDAATLAVPGARVVLDADLAAVGLSSYQLLAASHSLVTDYSSIWTDYLSTGKHVAFAVPDWEVYAATRGLDDSVGMRRPCPGPVVFSVEDFVAVLPRHRGRAASSSTAQRDRSIRDARPGHFRGQQPEADGGAGRAWCAARDRCIVMSARHVAMARKLAGASSYLPFISSLAPFILLPLLARRVTSAEWAGLGHRPVGRDGGCRGRDLGLAAPRAGDGRRRRAAGRGEPATSTVSWCGAPSASCSPHCWPCSRE